MQASTKLNEYLRQSHKLFHISNEYVGYVGLVEIQQRT